MENWVKEVADVVNEVEHQVPNTKSPDEVYRLGEKVDVYRSQQKGVENRLRQMDDTLRGIHGKSCSFEIVKYV